MIENVCPHQLIKFPHLERIREEADYIILQGIRVNDGKTRDIDWIIPVLIIK